MLCEPSLEFTAKKRTAREEDGMGQGDRRRGKRRRERMRGGWGGTRCRSSVCGESNAWNPNCVIAPEQTLVLPVIPRAAGSEGMCAPASMEGDNSMSPADKEST